MTGRDRIVIVVLAALAVLAAAWLLVVAPEREKATKLGAEVSTAQSQLTDRRKPSERAPAARRRATRPQYASLVNLGKAVPTGQEVPSLIFQLAQATNEKHVEFTSITSGGSAGGSSASSSAAPAAASAGFTAMPFTFVFNGSFFDLYDLFQQLNHFTLRTSSGSLQVSGRLLTIQGVKLAPERPRREQVRRPADGHDHCHRVRAPREPGRDRGATATSPTGAQTTSGSAASSPATPAVIGAPR